MTKEFLLPNKLVQKIAKVANTKLILQWGYHDALEKNWNAMDPKTSGTAKHVSYHIMLVVADDEPSSHIELVNKVRALCPRRTCITPHIFLQKDALRKIKDKKGSIATAYRMGYPLYNAAEDQFPNPGIARLPIKFDCR